MVKERYDHLQKMRGLEIYDRAFENFLSVARQNNELQTLVHRAYDLGFGAYYDEDGQLIAFARIRNIENHSGRSIFEILSEGKFEEIEKFAQTETGREAMDNELQKTLKNESDTYESDKELRLSEAA